MTILIDVDDGTAEYCDGVALRGQIFKCLSLFKLLNCCCFWWMEIAKTF